MGKRKPNLQRHLISQEKTAEPLIKLLEQQKTKCQQARKYYQKLETNLPVEEQWKVLKVKKLSADLDGMIPGRTYLPTTILDSIIGALDEYLCALKSFTPDQMAAFMLGLGMRWFSFEYWGVSRQQKWHRLRFSVRGGIQVFSCMQENT